MQDGATAGFVVCLCCGVLCCAVLWLCCVGADLAGLINVGCDSCLEPLTSSMVEPLRLRRQLRRILLQSRAILLKNSHGNNRNVSARVGNDPVNHINKNEVRKKVCKRILKTAKS